MSKILWQGVVTGHVVPKARPRVSKTRTYMPPVYQDCRKRIKLQVMAGRFPAEPVTGPVSLDLMFYRTGAGDVDNLAGTVMEALEGLIYKNDGQVKELRAWVIKTPKDNEKVVITVKELAKCVGL